MQVTGRSVVMTAVAVALVMSGGAWWYHYRASRQAAQFWGAGATQLLIGKGEVIFLDLGEPNGADQIEGAGEIAGRAVTKEQVLSVKPGLIHLRHALTQDASFDWSGRRRTPTCDDRDWAYAIRFVDGPYALDVVWRRDFSELGAVTADGKYIEVLPCPRLAPAVQTYLRDVGVLAPEKAIR